MIKIAPMFACAMLGFAPATAQVQHSTIEQALSTGISACEKWVLEPATWAENQAAFPSNAGLANSLEAVRTLPRGIMPAEAMAGMDRFWRIDGGSGSGAFIIASTIRPSCNVSGGGPGDFQPAAKSLVDRIAHGTAWRMKARRIKGDMVSTEFELVDDKKAMLVVTHASNPNLRTDRVQFMATLTYRIGK